MMARVGKSKVALLVGYTGTLFRGSQVQPGVRTVEGDLYAALHAARLVSDVNFAGGPSKVAFSRSSRTDRGVHALACLFGVKVLLDRDQAARDPHGTALADALNALLAPDVRVFACVRVPASFNARHGVTSRTYQYWLPRHVLGTDAAALQRMDRACARFVGLHRWHNFVGGGGGGGGGGTEDDAGAVRLDQNSGGGDSLRRQVTACGIVAADDAFVRMEITGQSFVFNQIRKMVGMAVFVARGHADVAAVDVALRCARVYVPRAPPHGLVLVRSDTMALRDTNCTPHRELGTLFASPTVAAAMARFMRDTVEPEISAAYTRDDPWPEFGADLARAADSAAAAVAAATAQRT